MKSFKIKDEFNIISYIILISIIIILNSCRIPAPRVFDTIMYDKIEYKSTNENYIIIYESRLDINQKYKEIGAIKAIKTTTVEEIKSIAAQKGAHAIINDGHLNYTLIRFLDWKEEKKKDVDIKKI